MAKYRNDLWVLLVYKLPRIPSNPRVTIWRKLRRLGVMQIGDGLVALPANAHTQEQLEWIADEVVEAGGVATIWFGSPGSASYGKSLMSKMASSVSKEYNAIVAEAALSFALPPKERRRTLARLRREYWRVHSRDYFSVAERDQAYALLVELGAKEDEDTEVTR